jgi:beta-glucosidase
MPMEALPATYLVPGWRAQVDAFNARLPSLQREARQLVFIGDSITASWDPGVFSQFYGKRAPLLMGIIGDSTQGVLRRLPSEWGPLRPRLAVLLIGTNNTKYGGSKPEDVALGVAEIVRLIHARSSETRVLIVGILPTGAEPGDPLRAIDARTNSLLARCADERTTEFVDVGRALLNGAGQLTSDISFDGLHLTPMGYAVLARALEPEIARILGP